MLIAAPSDENECRRLLTTAFMHHGPSAVRYPRGSGTGVVIEPGLDPLEIGRGMLRRSGCDVALVAFGSLVAPALAAGELLGASVADMRFVKPLDTDLLVELAHSHHLLVTLEENAVAGGAGAAVAEALTELGLDVPVLHLGLPDTFIEHGDPARMLADCGLDAAGIEQAVRQRMTLLPHEGTPTFQALKPLKDRMSE